jgi:hypothetical protein
MSKKKGEAPLATPESMDEARLIATEDHIEFKCVIDISHTYYLIGISFRLGRQGSGADTSTTVESSSNLSGQKMPARTSTANSPPSTPAYMSSPSTSRQNHVQITKPDASLQQIHTTKPDDLLPGKFI